MRALFKIIGLLVVIALIVVVVAVFNFERAIKAAFEELGPDYVKAPISLAEVDLSPLSGEGKLGGLVIGNPQGYQTDYAFSLGEILIKVDTATLKENVIVIERVHILNPSIIYESANGSSNIKQLQKNIMSAVGDSGSGSASVESTGEPSGEGVKIIIRDLQVLEGQVRYSNPLLGGKTVDLVLPDIKLTNIGQKSGGATAAKVLEQILTAVNKQTNSAIANSGAIKELQGQLKGKIEEKTKGALGDKLQGLFGE